MDQCGVENKETVVNEHSEVIGLIKDDRDTNSPILNGQNSVPDSNEIEIFHPPPTNPESDSNETNFHENGNGEKSFK